ncbi:hypothetical protein MKK69_03415 [Methylobacterium sp. J-026]|uniref:hypothetical protein n=1 Tax=Methylobacterium sp. J-026 TaxID=2836624 RepID=UPI001FB8D848|nr:hypothetical protein [Methylobacterium sp. J-026]MCJ2133121.1 hypothetical protein [Methylobacterium sp. J-026]
MSETARMPHPGQTSAERRALDRIGCGKSPGCSAKTLKALLDAGLIVDHGGEVRRDAFGLYKVPSYGMPLPVHYQWCSAAAFTDEEMEAFEAEMCASHDRLAPARPRVGNFGIKPVQQAR